MAEKIQRRNLGRGLSALIPDVDMDFLSQIVRDEPKASIPVNKKKLKSTPAMQKSGAKKSGKLPAFEPKILENSLDSESEDTDSTSAVNTDSTDEFPLHELQNPTKSLSTHELEESHDGDLATKIDFVRIEAIEANPYQPRRFFSPQELDDLVNSLREHGVLQPIILRPLPGGDSTGRYQLIAGERRWRAAQQAGLSEIPAIIRPVTDQQALELALIENVQRHDISALDAAIAYRRLSQEFSLSQEQVAQRVGKSRSSVANTIRLLDLPTEAQKAIEEGVLSEGHGRAILLTATDGARRAVLRRVLRDKLSVRATEELAREIADSDDIIDGNTVGEEGNSDDAPLKKDRLSPEARRIEEALQKHLGTKVKFKLRRQGGQIMIHYFSNEELDRLLKLIIK